jgi:hypothetical protein
MGHGVCFVEQVESGAESGGRTEGTMLDLLATAPVDILRLHCVYCHVPAHRTQILHAWDFSLYVDV